MKLEWIVILVTIAILATIAVVAGQNFSPRPPLLVSPFRLDGLQLKSEDQHVERWLGPELPGSLCPPGEAHDHRYPGGTRVVFNPDSFDAEQIDGSLLEARPSGQSWVAVLRTGQPASQIRLPGELPLHGNAGALQLQPLLREGRDLRARYCYHNPGSPSTDRYDLDILVESDEQNRVGRIRLRWQGH